MNGEEKEAKARILNKGDLQHTVSTVAANAKKKKQKKNKSIRNTLALPSKQLWPEVPESDSTDIKTLLQELLPAAKIVCKKRKLKWKDLRKKSQEERKAYNQELKKSMLVPEERKFLLPGHRSVSRAVETNHASCCIISGNVEPKFMMAGILSACQHNGIPVIVLPRLKGIIRRALSFSATALAFKKCVSESKENKFYPIYKQVSKLAKQFSSLSNHDGDDDTMENAEESSSRNETVNCTKHMNGIEKKNETNTKPFQYLYLKSDGSRAFVPERERAVNVKSPIKQMEFISLSTNSNNSKPKPNRKRPIEEEDHDLIGTDDEPEVEEMDFDSLFTIDMEGDELPPDLEVVKDLPFPEKPKHKKQKIQTYFPVNIKTVRSNPEKAVKPKKKRMKN